MDNDDSVAQSATTSLRYPYNGKLLVISLSALVAICITIALIHSYAGWAHHRRRNRQFRSHRRRPPNHLVFATATARTPPKDGLQRSILDSIPTFIYDAALHHPPLECPVCLSEFVSNELGRVLPNCNHCFHVDCVDMWFYSRSNCPLCRAPVQPSVNPVGDTTITAETSGSGCRVSNSGLWVDDKVGGSSSSLLSKPPEMVGIIVEVPATNLEFDDSNSNRKVLGT